ncbi:uncharacterized protein V6R79_024521 [Siganus canaliculatus]
MESRILLLLILTSSVWAGTFELNQTQSFYQALENQNITLEWTFTLRRLLRYYQVFCQHITGPRISVVLHVEQGVQYPASQNRHFKGRVQFDADAFREGRLRVHVSRLQTQDSGLYRCNVATDYGSNVGKCRLNVSAAANETQTLRPGPERPGPEFFNAAYTRQQHNRYPDYGHISHVDDSQHQNTQKAGSVLTDVSNRTVTRNCS